MLRPSRRIPRAFERPSSAFSRAMAKALYQSGRPRFSHGPLATLRRQGRKWMRGLSDASRRLRLGGVILLVSVSFVALLLFFLSPLFRVSSMRVSREDARLDIEEVEQRLLPFFGKHLFFLSPRLVEQHLLAAYPDMASVDIVKHFPHTLSLTLHLDPIVADVQLGSPDATERSFTPLSGSGTYRYLTARGMYLESPIPLAHTSNEEERLTINIVDWAVKPAHRQALLEAATLHAMQDVQRLLRQSFGQTVRTMTYYVRAREFHVDTGPSLWFDLATPLVQQLDRYREFLRALPPGSAEKYVDLRLHDLLVYQ